MTTKEKTQIVKTLLNSQLQLMKIGAELETMFDLDLYYILEDAQEFCVGVDADQVTDEQAIKFLSSMTK